MSPISTRTWLADEVHDLLEQLLDRPAWQADALCREHPEVSWFPERGVRSDPAKRICERCHVAEECAAWALDQGPELAGIWAGLTDGGRRQYRKHHPSQAA